MTDNATLIALNTYIVSHTKVIRNMDVLTDIDLSELFEMDIQNLLELIGANLQRFKDESMIILSADEKILYTDVHYAFQNSGIFILAGLIKTKRAIRIYVQLIELLVNKLQNRAYEIATNYPTVKA